MSLKSIKLDGVEYEAEAEVIKTLNQRKDEAEQAKKELEAIKVDNSKLEAEKDNFKEKADNLEKELAEYKDGTKMAAQLDEAVAKRLRILDAAKKVELEVKGDETELELQKAVILKIHPTAKLDEKDAIYIEARFDGALDQIESNNDSSQTQTVKGQDIPNKDGQQKLDATAARKKMIKGMKDDSRGIKQE